MSENILDLAGQVAVALWGSKGRAEQAYGLAGQAFLYLDGSEQKLFMRYGWQDTTRLEIGDMYPKTDANVEHHKITVSATRKPVAIANDISRRLLPGYRAELAKAQESNRKEAGNQGKRLAAMAEVVAAMGSTAGQDEDMPDRYRARVTASMEDGYGEVEIGHNGEYISLNLRYLPKKVALKMLAVLAQQD